MNTKSLRFLYIFLTGILILSFEFFYLYSHKKSSNEESFLFVKLTGLPDLSFYSETEYVRHRTLSSVFETFKDDGTLLENSKASFVIKKKKF